MDLYTIAVPWPDLRQRRTTMFGSVGHTGDGRNLDFFATRFHFCSEPQPNKEAFVITFARP
jgi:hypothetical protein